MSQRSVRIFVPPRSAMQSGRAKSHDWAVEYLPGEAKQLEPLMGWSGSGDTERQLRLSFESKEAAIAWATAQGLGYAIEEPPARAPIKPKVYADNFKYGRTVNWTH